MLSKCRSEGAFWHVIQTPFMKTEILTADQIRIRIAKLCGWKEIRKQQSLGSPGLTYGLNPRTAGISVIPDYPNDLNCCAEFEKTLTHKEREEFISALRRIATSSSSSHWNCATATARQRCIAFLKTKGAK